MGSWDHGIMPVPDVGSCMCRIDLIAHAKEHSQVPSWDHACAKEHGQVPRHLYGGGPGMMIIGMGLGQA